ncbi:MAG: hypothetical protein COC08_04045 [Maribacter sp.]|nr:MAG: hypothetical protein COC08_04045 [Maribacter sp.]
MFNHLLYYNYLRSIPIARSEFILVTVPDWLARFFTYIILSWLVLKFNLVWLDKLFQTSTINKGSVIVKSFFGILGSIAIAIGLHFLFLPVYTLIFGIEISKIEQSNVAFGKAIMLIPILLISFVLKLQLKSKNNAIVKERLKQEKVKSELVAIKNQVNPHFLFNSLNTLNSVIRNNPESATDFVDKLSFMYRYILQSSEKGLVTLAEELTFLNSYTYLINIRYANRFKLIYNINVDINAIKIPVLSLQLLVENAVKHNEISESNPLIVRIYKDGNYISVENEIKPRTNLEESTGNGLLNLSKRYKILKGGDIKIYKNTNFIVKLPIS